MTPIYLDLTNHKLIDELATWDWGWSAPVALERGLASLGSTAGWPSRATTSRPSPKTAFTRSGWMTSSGVPSRTIRPSAIATMRDANADARFKSCSTAHTASWRRPATREQLERRELAPGIQ